MLIGVTKEEAADVISIRGLGGLERTMGLGDGDVVVAVAVAPAVEEGGGFA